MIVNRRRCINMCLRASFITLRSIVIVKLLGIQRLTNAFGLLLSVKAVQYSSAHRSPEFLTKVSASLRARDVQKEVTWGAIKGNLLHLF